MGQGLGLILLLLGVVCLILHLLGFWGRNRIIIKYVPHSLFFLFVLFEALRPSQQFFSHVWTFSLVEPVLSNADEVSCLRTQHRAPGEI